MVWSRRNYAADAAVSPVEEGQRGGLTKFGGKVVNKMEEMNNAIDVSHLNDEGFGCTKIHQKAFYSSHSNSKQFMEV